MALNDVSTRELAERVHALAIHLLRRVRAADTESGMSAARLSALSVLVFGGPRLVGELAEAEQVTAPTMSRLVAGLVADGLVRREDDASDRRRVRVVATAAGKRALETARARRVDRMSTLVAALGPARRASVLEAVSILELALRDSAQNAQGEGDET